MTLGEKIRAARKMKKMTQAELASDKITRNMLSAIECDKATPSLETLKALADGLSIPVGYLVSPDTSLFLYERDAVIGKIRDALKIKKYSEVIRLASTLSELDDELCLVLAHAHSEIGKRAVLGGSLESGKKHISLALDYAGKTIYDTEKIEHAALLYGALAENIQAPLLILDIKKFEHNIFSEFDYDLFKYLSFDESHSYKNPLYAKHISARALMKSRHYQKALAVLKEIEDGRTPETYNAYAIFSVYSDIESCYRQLGDFENAYRYATKRLSLIEGFKA